MAIITFIKFPTNAIMTKEQLEAVSGISDNKFEEIFKRTYISGVLSDNLTEDKLKPVVKDTVGSTVNFTVSAGAGIMRNGYMIILESPLNDSVDISANLNKTLCIKFSQDWSDDITTIQKPTGNMINVSKIQLQTTAILEWLDFDPTIYSPGVDCSNYIPLGQIIADPINIGENIFKLDDGYRHLFFPNIRYPEKAYNISPSVDTFCSIYEFLSSRGGGQRTITNPFGLSIKNVKDLLEVFISFIENPGIVNKEANQLLVSGTGSNIMRIYSGRALSANGKYVENTVVYEENLVGVADNDYYVYIRAIEDVDGYDTFEFVRSTTTFSSDDYILLAKVTITSETIISISDLRIQLTLLASAADYNPPHPPKHPGLYILEKNLNPYTNLYDYVARYGDGFNGNWISNNQFEMSVDHGWADGVWDEPDPEENVNPWYLDVSGAGLHEKYKIKNGKTLSGSGNYTFELDGECGYSFPPPVAGVGQIVTEADFAIIDSNEDGEEEFTGHSAIFEGGYSYKPINIVGLKPGIDHDLRIKAFLNGIPSIISDEVTETIPSFDKELAGCKVYLSVNTGYHSYPVGSSEVLIPFDAVLEDTYSEFDTVNNKFVVGHAGTYLVSLTIYGLATVTVSNLKYLDLEIKKNGSLVSVNNIGAVKDNTIREPRPTLTDRLILEENDEITFYVKMTVVSSSVSMRLQGAQTYNTFASLTQIE